MDSHAKQLTPSGQLFVVATPIGNLADISYRAVETLKSADLIAAEDTRTSRKLLLHYGIETPMMALHEHNEAKAAQKLLPRLEAGENIALISDAGTPLISDPGYRLVTLLRESGIRVTPIPGASSVITGLCASGLTTDRFTFLGFLPRSGKQRRAALARITTAEETTIILESPRRLLATIRDLAEIIEEKRQLCVARELTKLHEEFINGTAAELVDHFETQAPRGEIVLMIAPASAEKGEVDDDAIIRALESEAMLALPPSARAKAVARDLGIEKSRAYNLINRQ